MSSIQRRRFLRQTLGALAASSGVGSLRTADAPAPLAPPHTITVIAGKPRERGRAYGKAFRDGIGRFLREEIYNAFTATAPSRDEVLRYAAACGREVRGFSPTIHDELEGIAEGAGLTFEEAVLITLHEELWHKGVLPPVEKCTAIAVGPPDTAGGATYVAQTWDWMQSVYGRSELVWWKREEGPAVLGYAYPGLWIGAGMSEAGLALTWTSGDGMGIKGPRAGIPSYVLIAHMLYQPTLKDALAEARRARHAGWFTFVLGDRNGELANVEGSPEDGEIEVTRGHLARALFGTRRMTRSGEGGPIKRHPRCAHMYELLAAEKGKIDRAAIARLLSNHGSPGKERVCCHPATLDAMIFDVSRLEAHLTRGPTCSDRWKTFRVDAR